MLEALRMLKYFPLLLPSHNFKYWEGAVNVMGSELFLRIDCPNYPSIEGMSIKSAAGIQSAINDALKQVQCISDLSLIDALKVVQQINVLHLITFNVEADSKYNKINDMSWFDRYNRVLEELKSIGTENVIKTDGALTCLTLKKEDDYGYDHFLGIKLPDDYPSSKPVLENFDLPDLVLSNLMSSNTIIDIFSEFCSVIMKLQNFWNVYDELRTNSWVIDPEVPKKKDTYCRIMIGNNISVLITLNPLEVMSFPDIKFLGADKAVAPFRKALENNLKEFGWDMDNCLVNNLLTILGIEEFPKRPSINDSQQKLSQLHQDAVLVADQECCICFMIHIDDSLRPTKICNNDKCTSVVHITCLAEWFQCVPTNEPSFNLISGNCPHCGMRILCPIKHNLKM